MRPQADTRAALVRVLGGGVEGDFEALASQVGAAPAAVQATLSNLRREGKVVVRLPFAPLGAAVRAGRGRPRAVYALASQNTRQSHVQALAQALSTWR